MGSPTYNIESSFHRTPSAKLGCIVQSLGSFEKSVSRPIKTESNGQGAGVSILKTAQRVSVCRVRSKWT